MKVATANRLIDGEAVWLSPGGRWASHISEADVATDASSEERLDQRGKAGLAANEVVDFALVDVTVVDGVIRPNRLRERIRANGPTTHPHLGKQAEATILAGDDVSI